MESEVGVWGTISQFLQFHPYVCMSDGGVPESEFLHRIFRVESDAIIQINKVQGVSLLNFLGELNQLNGFKLNFLISRLLILV